MRFQLEILPRTRKQLLAMPERLRQETVDLLRELQHDPHPAYAEPLRAEHAGIFKIKIDGWRIFYRVAEHDQSIKIINIKRRDRNTYLALYSILY